MTDRAIVIRARADAVYPLIADPLRMAEWSPECVRCRWMGGTRRAEVGARFRGTSRNGWRRWRTTSTIAEMRDGELFAWEVTYFRLAVARWEYRLDPNGDDVRLTEAVDDRRGRLLRTLSPLITGSPDRHRRNADTMETTLAAIKAAAEAPDR
ncbi:MAG TPA: SRPBCC family protein [Ilumatobacteraceae bacterium]|nr:SRPBCC family protein [Ilumatobacteraceae bacterium]